jgi:bacterioferritin-associated ferredoxin
MIVCSCNVFSDHDVRNAVTGERPPRTPGQVYGCLGCSAQCGRCVRTIKKIMDEALGACAKSCCAGCPHSAAHGHDQADHAHVEVHAHVELAVLASAEAAA